MGNAQSGEGNTASGPATNAVRRSFLTDKLVIGLFFIVSEDNRADVETVIRRYVGQKAEPRALWQAYFYTNCRGNRPGMAPEEEGRRRKRSEGERLRTLIFRPPRAPSGTARESKNRRKSAAARPEQVIFLREFF